MINYDAALKKAYEYLQDSEVPLQITHQGEFSEGWFFCFESKEYLETGDLSAQLAGNGPFLIDKYSGELHVLGTAKSLDEYLIEYVKDKKSRLV
jgi:hypothetical protein